MVSPTNICEVWVSLLRVSVSSLHNNFGMKRANIGCRFSHPLGAVFRTMCFCFLPSGFTWVYACVGTVCVGHFGTRVLRYMRPQQTGPFLSSCDLLTLLMILFLLFSCHSVFSHRGIVSWNIHMILVRKNSCCLKEQLYFLSSNAHCSFFAF